MSAPRALLAAVLVVSSVLAQTIWVAALRLPFGEPDVIVVVVVAIALAAGATAGMGAGFGAGLLADLLSDHPAGLLALVLCLVGFACGLLTGGPDREGLPGRRDADVTAWRWTAFAAVAGSAVSVLLGYAGLLAILGSPRLDWRVVAGSLPGSAAYDVILALVVLPVVIAMYRRLES
ncbi:MAG: rod shape-determining protein MreD [Mycobacteriales bacterium]